MTISPQESGHLPVNAGEPDPGQRPTPPEQGEVVLDEEARIAQVFRVKLDELWTEIGADQFIPEPDRTTALGWSTAVFEDILRNRGLPPEAPEQAEMLAKPDPRLREERRALSDDARSDPQTGIGNKKSLNEFTDKLTDDQNLLRGKALCYLDLNGLKAINDNFGEEAGHYVIKMFTARVRAANDHLFDDEAKAEGQAAQMFRLSGGADDVLVFVPIGDAVEFVKYAVGTFGQMDGNERDYEHKDSNGEPEVLVPPQNVRVQSGRKENANQSLGYLSVSSGEPGTEDYKEVKVSISAGIVTAEDLAAQGESIDAKQLIGHGFAKMKADKDSIKKAFPDLAIRD